MKGRLASRLSIATVLAIAVAVAIPWIALADGWQVDNDLIASGLQNVVDLTAAPGGTVSTDSKIVIDWSGKNHLVAGTVVTFKVDDQKTTLPAGYTVGDATVTVPNPWDKIVTSPSGTSHISFTAPTSPGTYSYEVKWAPSVDYGNELTGGSALTINLTVAGDDSYCIQVLNNEDHGAAGNNTLPIKIQVWQGGCGTGTNISSENLAVHADSIDGSITPDDAGNSNPDGFFRYDPDLQGYIFTLDTDNLSAGSHELQITVGGNLYVGTVPFDIRVK